MPPEVAQQYQDIVQRSQWQRAQLEQGGAGIRKGRGRSGAGDGGSGEGGSRKGLERGLFSRREVCAVGRELNPMEWDRDKSGDKQLPSPDPHCHSSRVRNPSGAPAALLYRSRPAPGL